MACLSWLVCILYISFIYFANKNKFHATKTSQTSVRLANKRKKKNVYWKGDDIERTRARERKREKSTQLFCILWRQRVSMRILWSKRVACSIHWHQPHWRFQWIHLFAFAILVFEDNGWKNKFKYFQMISYEEWFLMRFILHSLTSDHSTIKFSPG